MFYIYSDIPQERDNNVKDQAQNNNFRKLNTETLIPLKDFEKYISYQLFPSYPDALILYGYNLDRQMSFIYYKIVETEQEYSEKGVKKIRKIFNLVSEIKDFKKVVKGGVNSSILHIQMDPLMNFIICCYENGSITRIQQ